MSRIVPVSRLRFGVSAEGWDFAQMRMRFAEHQAAGETPELAAIEAVWNSSQTDSRMPGYAQDIIRHFQR